MSIRRRYLRRFGSVPVVAMWCALAASCAESLPLVPTAPHPTTETRYVEVPYPPPPGHVEKVPPRPRADALWVDGQWDWEGLHWVWQPGGWVAPSPQDAYFAPFATTRLADGKLLLMPASWYGKDNRPIAAPAVLASAGQAE